MSRQFNLLNSPYDDRVLFKKNKIEIKQGITSLVGCNGSGKSTLLESIEYNLKKSNIPVLVYNNEIDGGQNSMDIALHEDDLQHLASLVTASEGEKISLNLDKLITKLGEFITLNDNRDEIWFLLDGIDSGLSIDYIVLFKDFLKNCFLKDNKDKKIYVIYTANTYEMCYKVNCFDVYEGVYKTFNSYDEYKQFILKSQEIKKNNILESQYLLWDETKNN